MYVRVRTKGEECCYLSRSSQSVCASKPWSIIPLIVLISCHYVFVLLLISQTVVFSLCQQKKLGEIVKLPYKAITPMFKQMFRLIALCARKYLVTARRRNNKTISFTRDQFFLLIIEYWKFSFFPSFFLTLDNFLRNNIWWSARYSFVRSLHSSVHLFVYLFASSFFLKGHSFILHAFILYFFLR